MRPCLGVLALVVLVGCVATAERGKVEGTITTATGALQFAAQNALVLGEVETAERLEALSSVLAQVSIDDFLTEGGEVSLVSLGVAIGAQVEDEGDAAIIAAALGEGGIVAGLSAGELASLVGALLAVGGGGLMAGRRMPRKAA